MAPFEIKQLNKTLQEKLKKKSLMELPKVVMISVNAGVGRLEGDKGLIAKVATDLSKITGQHAVVTKAKKSISAFKLRENSPVGVTVTLRGQKMIDFLLKLINVTLPRLRDFNGINPDSLDQQGNLSIGFKEQIFFPEIRYEDVDKTFGLQVNIKTKCSNRDDARVLFESLGLPFKKEDKNG
jgi:large subunit ribosomal protein L5